MEEHDTDTLDSIIQLINREPTDTIFNNYYQSERLAPVFHKPYNPPSHNRSNGNINLSVNNQSVTTQPLKRLKFKPWSGVLADARNGIMFDEIKEEIAGDTVNEVEEYQEYTEREKGSHIQEGEEKGKDQKQVQETNSQTVVQNGYYYKFQNGAVKLIKQLLEQNGFHNTPPWYEDWTMYWSSGPVKLQIYPQLNPYQKVNHFPNSFQITRKDLMNKNISKMQIKYGLSHFNFLPKTFILPLQLSQFEQEYSKTKRIYIVKPHNRSQGKGIIVTDQISVIYSRLEKYSSLVVSEYVDNPLLINGFKFDLRIYVGITSIYPLRIYVYQEGLARFATESYNNEMGEDRKNFRHLTNYSVNKKNQNFVSSAEKGEDYFGSKWSLTSLKDFMEYNIGKPQTTELFERIDDLVIKTILSVENSLFTNVTQYVPYINNCFEILGFDVLIDSTLKPWLVEVNLSPSMNTDSPLDLKIKGSVVSDMFTMLGVVPHSERYTNNGHLRNLTTKHVNAKGNRSQLEGFQKYVIKQMEAEENARGGWKRVFPASNAFKYTGFFETDRYLNAIARGSIKQLQIGRVIVPRTDSFKHRNSVPAEARFRSSTKQKARQRELHSSKNLIKVQQRQAVRLQRLLPKRPSLKFRIR